MNIYQVREKLRTGISIFDLELRVGYYTRVSTDKMEQKLSIDNQQTYFEELVKSHPKWTLVSAYVDDGISGIHTEKREDFQRMINDSKLGKVDLILTKEISRFARNTLDSIQWTRKMLNYGTCIWFINDNINTIDTDSEFRLTIMAGVAQDEVRKLSTRVSFGHAQSIKKGRVLGADNLYGLKKKDCKYEIIEKEAKMIRTSFELYSTGEWSTKSLEKYLYEQGYRNRKGGKISSKTIQHILTNPKYKGYYCGGKVKVIDMFSKKQEFLPEEDWVMYKDESGEVVPAIVSEELWDKVNELFKERSEVVKSRRTSFKGSENLFTGKIKCGIDGETYWLKARSIRGEPDFKWRCSHKINNGAKSCPSFSIDEEELKKMLSDIINNLFGSFDDVYDNYIEMFEKISGNVSADNNNKINEILSNIENLKKKKDKLLDCFLNELITKEEMKLKTQKMNEQLTELENDLKKLQPEEGLEDYTTSIKNRLDYIKNLLAKFAGVTSDGITKQLIDDVVKEIIITPDGENIANVVFYLNDKNIDTINKTYNRKSKGRTSDSMCCSENTIFNLFPEQHTVFTRNLRSCIGHSFTITYNYTASL